MQLAELQSYDKSRLLVSLMLLVIVTFVFVAILTNNAFAQKLHDKTLFNLAHQPSESEISKIDVGNGPKSIYINYPMETIYVANSGSDSISVISAENNTKIGKDIPVGKQSTAIAIYINIIKSTNTVYVANSGNDSVSVISAEKNTKIKDIPVGKQPIAIAVNKYTNTVYVANFGSNTVSVINETSNTNIKNITVGKQPTAIAINIDKTKNPNIIYVANAGSDSVSVIDGTSNTNIKNITVGKHPTFIAVKSATKTVYVANQFSGTVSVISAENNTKIKDIPVGDKPIDVAINQNTNTVYVANSGNDSVSVISAEKNTKIKDIPVGDEPIDVAINQNTNTVYVANSGNDSVSVISAENNTKIKDIPVGKQPTAIAINQKTNTVYVLNSGSYSVSVIEGLANEVVAGVTFRVHPFNSGYIVCPEFKAPLSKYFFVYEGTTCIAKPNTGFEFLSWEENLKDNSTQLIKLSNPVYTIFEQSTDWFQNMVSYFGLNDFLNIQKPVESEAELNIKKFGSFTANFKELPPPISAEVFLNQYTAIALAVLSGLVIPQIIPWVADRRQIKYFRKYLELINNPFNEKKDYKNDEFLFLNSFNDKILQAYLERKLNEKQYGILKDEISEYYEKVFKEKILSFKDKLFDNKEYVVISEEISDAHTTGKIKNDHYLILRNEFSILFEELYKHKIKEIESLDDNRKDIGDLLVKIKGDIADAYSKGKLTELHYNLLKEKISELEKKNNNTNDNRR